MKINHEMIGRTEEKKIMLSLLDKNNPELVMLTGRRRVGKTYIIEQVYKNNIVFSFTGTKKDTMKNQLKKFMTKLILLDKNKLFTIIKAKQKKTCCFFR
jgi:AAA+ ATPase superfamily predicted ATPase